MHRLDEIVASVVFVAALVVAAIVGGLWLWLH